MILKAIDSRMIFRESFEIMQGGRSFYSGKSVEGYRNPHFFIFKKFLLFLYCHIDMRINFLADMQKMYVGKKKNYIITV